MKEPTARTWGSGWALTFVLSLVIDHILSGRFTVREVFKTLSYSILITTVGWLISMARWHRRVLKG